ncbi:MAG: hypothetical protein ABFS56_20720 [Pseudomonadota bacterium]
MEIDKYILGETKKEFVCISEEDNQQIAVSMIEQTALHLDILSRDFEPEVYDNQACCDAIEDLALRSRHSRIRILLDNTKIASQRGHLILQLGKRLGSLMQFRSVAEAPLTETFLIADRIGIMHRSSPNTLAASVNFKDGQTAKKLSKLFDELWENATPEPEARSCIL